MEATQSPVQIRTRRSQGVIWALQNSDLSVRVYCRDAQSKLTRTDDSLSSTALLGMRYICSISGCYTNISENMVASGTNTITCAYHTYICICIPFQKDLATTQPYSTNHRSISLSPVLIPHLAIYAHRAEHPVSGVQPPIHIHIRSDLQFHTPTDRTIRNLSRILD